MADDVLVSCLMVTQASERRLAYGRRAIAAYCAQTHPRRELVIVLDQGPAEIRAALTAHVAGLSRDDIRFVEADAELPLGGLRNLSRASARGQVHCQWDDDDLHHPERVARQLAALVQSGAEAVCLEQVMQFFPANRALYCTNWRATEARVFPGSLMCLADSPARYPETGPAARIGEDTDLCVQLQRRDGLRALGEAPHLYVYVSHGANTWGDDHHAMLAQRLGLSQGLLRRHEARLREGLAPFDFGPGPVDLQGPNGVAFSLGG
jgi:hypothetical protein